ncbi:MAG TPA: glycoside hydrolase family 125 protein, partial [Firmicutes bacterium]|nr:glycoside hydrolase family 125 protein [Bacillota bacterium]
NYFFALGRAIDSDRWLPVTSRSPKYYVSAAFWARDALLWSFPGLLLTDAATAGKVLLNVFERHLERAGEHAHYIDGTLLYPGFELDQLAAYLLALKHYLQTTGDRAVLADERIKRALPLLLAKFLQWYNADVGLCGTFLDPSDDPPPYPYLIYSNALAQRALSFLARLAGKGLKLPGDPKHLALAIRTAIYRHGVVKGPYGPMFAWAVDGRGNFALYDNPPGSLLLLPHYGFCRREDPVWRHTLQWICSEHNPYRRAGRVLSGAASRHAGDPWPLAAANELLAGRTEAEHFFAAAKLDSGFCCESVDPDTGRAATGQAFASAAGFLGFALCHVYGSK